MSIRKISPLPVPKLYKDEYSISSFVEENKGMKVSDSAILSGNISDMVEGESQIDFASKIQVVKIKGSLYKQSLNSDNEIVLTKI